MSKKKSTANHPPTKSKLREQEAQYLALLVAKWARDRKRIQDDFVAETGMDFPQTRMEWCYILSTWELIDKAGGFDHLSTSDVERLCILIIGAVRQRKLVSSTRPIAKGGSTDITRFLADSPIYKFGISDDALEPLRGWIVRLNEHRRTHEPNKHSGFIFLPDLDVDKALLFLAELVPEAVRLIRDTVAQAKKLLERIEDDNVKDQLDNLMELLAERIGWLIELAQASQERQPPAAEVQPKKKRGRRPRPDSEKDARILDAWMTGEYADYEDLETALTLTPGAARGIIDRERKRRQRRKS